MKREGRQHGVVRTFRILPDPLNPRPESRLINSPPTAGLFQRVPSKFTAKCGRARCVGCHLHPPSKSRDKAKGTHKLRSFSSDHRRLLGLSATGLLGHLTCTDYVESDDDHAIGLSESDETDDGEIEIGEDLGMSYCDVGFTMEEIEIDFEGWCVLAEL